ncbi:MAG TPA: hypothetical protein ENJ82_18435 [Bacteroidetes bacterium]|nr:hypothetical protein [Bacteroidota bacterium]
MTRKRKIIRRIRRFVRENSLLFTRTENWYVGVTSVIERRKSQHERRFGRELVTFQSWQARSAREAADIEKRFLALGMAGAGGGWNQDSVYVYVYKRRGPYSR